ncbi:hypothetical protein [Methylobacterium planeticum]|nr:hypothetical protein [Methylobacterium planeticum]
MFAINHALHIGTNPHGISAKSVKIRAVRVPVCWRMRRPDGRKRAQPG